MRQIPPRSLIAASQVSGMHLILSLPVTKGHLSNDDRIINIWQKKAEGGDYTLLYMPCTVCTKWPPDKNKWCGWSHTFPLSHVSVGLMETLWFNFTCTCCSSTRPTLHMTKCFKSILYYYCMTYTKQENKKCFGGLIVVVATDAGAI